MAHEKVYGFCENKCKVEVSPKTVVDAFDSRINALENEVNGALSCTSITTSGTITSTGLITGNGGFKGNLTGNATTANKLNTVVTLSATSTELIFGYYGLYALALFTPGVTYTGIVKAKSSNSKDKIYFILSDKSVSSSALTSSYNSFSVPSNTVAIYLHCAASNYNCSVYLPSYTI